MDAEEATDRELVEAARAGRVAAFSAIVERYQQLICAVAYSACGNVSLSEDVAQETFVSAWTSIDKLEDAAKLKSWLCAIASNKSRDALRKRKREVPETEAELSSRESADPSPQEAMLASERESSLWSALSALPQTYRDVLVLFYREDQSIKQVAGGLGLSIAAVKQRLKRGREVLKTNMEPIGAALAHSRPSKAFTIAVVAAIAAKTGTAAAAGQSAAAEIAGAESSTAGAATSSSTAGLPWVLAIAAGAAVVIAAVIALATKTSGVGEDPIAESPPSQKSPSLYGGERNAPALRGSLSLAGVVLDGDDQPVAGATVTLSSDPPRLATTSADGEFRFSDLAENTYGIAAFAPGGSSVPTAARVDSTNQSQRITLRIEAGSTIEVEVLSRETQRPIADANVVLEAGLRASDAQTDARGIATFFGVTSADSFVTVAKAGYATTSNLVVVAGEPAIYQRRFVLRKGFEFSITLEDSDGNRIRNAEVSLANGSEAAPESDGTYRIDAAPSGEALLIIDHDDFEPLEIEVFIAEKQAHPLPVKLSKGRRVWGTVLDESGKPASGALVVATTHFTDHFHRKTIASEDGSFTLGGMPATTTLFATLHDKTSTPLITSLEELPSAGVTLTLGDHCIRGRAVTRSGEPAVGARVHAFALSDPPPPLPQSMDRAGDGGEFSLCSIAVGERYRLAALARGVSETFFYAAPNDVVASAGDSEVSIVVEPPGKITGRVRIPDSTAMTKFGVAIAGARYDLTSAPSRPIKSADGSFALKGIPPGTYAVSIATSKLRPIVISEVTVGPGETTNLGELTFPQPRRYRGTVRDRSGRPVPGALVIVDLEIFGSSDRLTSQTKGVDVGGDPYSIPVHEAARTTTDSEGRFVCESRSPTPGNYTLIADHPRAGRSAPLAVPATGEADIDLVVTPTGSIRGRVRGGGGVDVVAAYSGATVAAQVADRGSVEPQLIHVVLTNPDGTFLLGRLAPGDYLLSANERYAEPHIGADAAAVTVRSGKTTTVVVPPVLKRLPPHDQASLDELTQHADALCACADRSCLNNANSALEAFEKRHAEPPELLFGRYDTISSRIDKCIEKADSWPR